jgi:type IV pilus assembly protein PilM
MGSMKTATTRQSPLLFEDKPLFGLDIGHASLRVMEFDMTSRTPRLKGYGSATFDPAAVNQDGVIVQPELAAKAAVNLFSKHLVGDISTKRVAVAVPASRTLSRALQLPPKLAASDLDDAVQTGASQYLPVSTEQLYLDYTILRTDEQATEVFAAAIPRPIVDSYLTLTRLLGLEAIAFETSIGASAQLFALDKQSDIPSVLVDFGGKSSDITVYNQGLVVTGTVSFGGEDVTNTIKHALKVTPKEAVMLKSKYGLGASKIQKLIQSAIEPSLQTLLKEIRRTIRYYEERYNADQPIGQVVIMGGGANMPGLATYLTEHLRLPVRAFDPAAHINFGRLKPFYEADRASYVTVAGLAATSPSKVFA